jgi:catechol 2,3-dioxygenase-like lactoylglutathione lyase family enzyme
MPFISARREVIPMPRPVATFICSDIRVRNLVRALRFYRALGLRTVAKGRMGDGTTLAWLRDNGTGQLLELFQLSPRSPLYKPFRLRSRVENSLIFSLPDVNALIPRLRRKGAKVLSDFEDGDVRLTFVRDPDGTLLEFLSWAREAKGTHARSPLLNVALENRASGVGRRPRIR